MGNEELILSYLIGIRNMLALGNEDAEKNLEQRNFMAEEIEASGNLKIIEDLANHVNIDIASLAE